MSIVPFSEAESDGFDAAVSAIVDIGARADDRHAADESMVMPVSIVAERRDTKRAIRMKFSDLSRSSPVLSEKSTVRPFKEELVCLISTRS